MFYYLDGTVAEILPSLVVIDCGGVGYACKTTNHTLGVLKKGQRGKVYTHLQVGDGIFDLYGFASQNELNSFRMLLSVSGVGPKAALGILSSCTPENLAAAIVAGDEQILTAAPGIGKKIARRIILELKDRISNEIESETNPATPGQSAGILLLNHNKASEAAQALGALGYSPAEAAQALKGVDTENLPLEEIIRRSLKNMVK